MQKNFKIYRKNMYTHTHFWQIEDLNVKSKSIKYLKEKIKSLYYFGRKANFL